MSEGDVEESTPEDMALPAVDNGASLEPIKVADEGFRALADAYKNKNEEAKALQITQTQLRTDLSSALAVSEQLRKELETARSSTERLEVEMEEKNKEVERLMNEVDIMKKAVKADEPSSSSDNKYKSLQTQYAALQGSHLALQQTREKDKSCAIDAVRAARKKIGRLEQALREARGESVVKYEEASDGKGRRGTKRRKVESSVRDDDPFGNGNGNDVNIGITVAPIHPSSQGQDRPSSNPASIFSHHTPEKSPPKNHHEFWTARRPLTLTSRNNTPTKSGTKSKHKQIDSDGRTGKSEMTGSPAVRGAAVGKITQPVFEQKERKEVLETEESWLVRGLLGTMQRQEEERESEMVEALQERSIGEVDVGMRTRGVVLADDSQMPIRSAPKQPAKALPPYLRPSESDRNRHDSPARDTPNKGRTFRTPTTDRLHQRDSSVSPFTAISKSAGPVSRSLRDWHGGHKSKVASSKKEMRQSTGKRPLKRRDSFEDEHAVTGHSFIPDSIRPDNANATGSGSGARQIRLEAKVVGPGNIPKDLKEMQGMPIKIDDTTTPKFRINPARNNGIPFAYAETVRNKECRRHMQGQDCDECRNWHDATKHIPIVDNGPKWRDVPSEERLGEEDELEKNRQKHMDQVSRHRSDFPPPLTPPGYWQAAFPTTQEVTSWNAQAEWQRAEKQTMMRKEAEKPNGRYQQI